MQKGTRIYPFIITQAILRIVVGTLSNIDLEVLKVRPLTDNIKIIKGVVVF